MRRIATALLVLLAASPAGAAAQIGITGGYNRDSFGDFFGATFQLADETNGFNTGIFLDFAIGRVGIRPAIAYRQLREAILAEPDVPASDLEIIEIPLDIRVTIPLPVVSPYILAGPTVMFPSSSRSDVDEALAGATVQLGIGIGLEWDVGFRLWPELRFGTSLGGLVKDDPSGGSDLNTFVFRVGVSF